MFDNLTLVPHTDTELSLMMEPMNDITSKFQELISYDNYVFTWSGSYMLMSAANLLSVMNALPATRENKARTYYYSNSERQFQRRFRTTDGYGIIINEGPSTKFIPTDYPTAVYMENAQEFLKQTPHHFLKIFTNSVSNILYVWTNKPLEADTFYKLYTLMASLYNKENTTLRKFLEYMIADDITNAKQVLVDFFNSDEILAREFERFRACLRNRHRNQVARLERDISNYRGRIQDCENEIANMATQMRDLSEKLAYIKYMQNDEEDQKLFYKHLRKIPYLKSFKGNDNGTLHLEYEAPLIYFSDYPAEKLLAQPHRTAYSKEIIKMIISRKYQLITKCALEFDTGSFGITSDSIYNTSAVLQHPHIARYNCFGNHRQAINDSAATGDYIGAIEQITQAVLNLNLYDVCVVDSMCSVLNERRNSLRTWKCVETGEMLTTDEVIDRGDYK